MPDGIYLLDSGQVYRYSDCEGLERLCDIRVARRLLSACSSASCDYIFAVGGQKGEEGGATPIVERFNIH